MLAHCNDWTLSESPNPNADVNHFSSYIEFAERHSDFKATRTSAFFTHFEKGTPYKEFWWDLAAENIEMHITCAKQYARMLKPSGLVKVVRPPLDHKAFYPQSRKMKDIPVVGLSGFVDKRSNRKGEGLVARLAASDLGERITLKASGVGWPVQTSRRNVVDLPDFYRRLDLLICTSNREGIPMPPLEALACGIPIVIPTGIGMLDDLPDIKGIYRYKANDYQELETAIELACFGDRDFDVEELVEATAEYTEENYALDHKDAMDDLVNNAATYQSRESDRHGKRGVYYVAYGEPARRCAEGSITTFREFNNRNIEIALASDRTLEVEDYLISCPDVDIGGRHAKTKIYDFAPADWQYILYLDADTEIIANIEWLFQPLMDGWDMVICKNPGKYHIARKMIRTDNEDECNYTFNIIGTDELIQLNGGVFCFQRNERTANFFRCWHSEWSRWGKRDQAALLRALWAHPLKILVLTNVWNTITRYADKSISAGVLHYPMSARRWRNIVPYRSDDPRAWKIVHDWEEKEGI